MSEFTLYDHNSLTQIRYDKYAKTKKAIIDKKLFQTPDNNKITYIEYCLEQENDVLKETENRIEQRTKEFQEKYSNKSKRGKDRLHKKEVDNFKPIELELLKHQIQLVINWLNAEKEFLLSIQDKQNNSQATKKNDLGSTQNLTLALMSLILKVHSNDTSFDTSKLRDFIHLFVNKSSDNIKKNIENYKRMFLPYLLKDEPNKIISKYDKIAMINALKKTKEIFEIIQLIPIINQISDNIEELKNEI